MRLLTAAPSTKERTKELVKQVIAGYKPSNKSFIGETHYLNGGTLYVSIFRDNRDIMGGIEPFDGSSYSSFGTCEQCNTEIIGQLQRWYDDNQKQP